MKIKQLRSKDGQYYFTIVARNGRVICTSETYRSKQGMEKGVRLVMAEITVVV